MFWALIIPRAFPGSYKVVLLHNNVMAILPHTMTNKTGLVVSVAPLLETKITLPAKSRTPSETLDAIIDALNAVSKRHINHEPFVLPDHKKIVFVANHESSGSVLSRLEEEVGPFTCHILYDPPGDEYYANFRWLPIAQPTMTKPASAPPNTNNPWFSLAK